MSLYSKDILKDSIGGSAEDQYFYNVDPSGAGPDPNHQNGFSFGNYSAPPGHSQLSQQRPSLAAPMQSSQPQGLFRPQSLDSVHYVNSVPTPSRSAPAYPQGSSGLAGIGLSFPQSVNPPSQPASQASLGSRSLAGASDSYAFQRGFAAGQSLGLGVGLGNGQSHLRDDDSNDDFPALPSSKPDSGVLGSNALNAPDKFGESVSHAPMSLGVYTPGLFSTPAASGGSAPRGGSSDILGLSSASPASAGAKDGRYGLAGLMETNRATEKDAYLLAMGMDLTTFGLNLNSAESLYLTFTSPFADASTSEPQFQIPQCYNMHPPALKTEHLSKFHLETLFYMFYQMPRDILQAIAAQELYRRDWRYHAELRIWLKPRTAVEMSQSHNNIQFVYFDAKAWEVRLFNAAQVRGNLKAGLVSEEEIRVKPPLPGLAPIGEAS